jgi:peptidoglycan/xylan/chitin deacetylase (PgdA/CDA1 family)
MASPSTSRALRRRAVATLSRLPLERALALLGRWRGVLVLNHHRIGDPAHSPWDRSLWSATAERLDRQLRTLARHAEVIGPEELEHAVRAAPARRVLLTFDDGYRDNHALALPLLRAHRLTATFFIASGFLDEPRVAWWDEIAWIVRHAARAGAGRGGPADPVGARIAALVARYKRLPAGQGERFLDELAAALRSPRRRAREGDAQWMTWDMVRELRAAGMSIGGHTVTHPVLAPLSRARQREEIAGCARRLHEELGEPMRWFAYPVGGRGTFTPATRALLRESGVELAFSFYGGFAAPARFDPLDVPRVHVDARVGARLVAQRVEGMSLRPRFASASEQASPACDASAAARRSV